MFGKFYRPTLIPEIIPDRKPDYSREADALMYIARHSPVGSLVESFIDNVIRDTVTPIEGSILHCSLYGAEHSGIYVGGGTIVELTGTGEIRTTNPRGFLQGTHAITIYVACNGENPLGCGEVAERAQEMSGRQRDYNLLLDNCHRFTSGCILDDFNNYNTLFSLLETVIAVRMNGGKEITWRAWDLPTELKF